MRSILRLNMTASSMLLSIRRVSASAARSMKTLKILVCTLVILLFCDSCKLASVKYSMTGASISPDVKTYSVDYFPNRALLVVPYLSTLFREKLTEYLRTKTSLKEMTDNNGDIRFEGEIVGYYQKPIDIQRDEIASSNRLTIEIRVNIRISKMTNTISTPGFLITKTTV